MEDEKDRSSKEVWLKEHERLQDELAMMKKELMGEFTSGKDKGKTEEKKEPSQKLTGSENIRTLLAGKGDSLITKPGPTDVKRSAPSPVKRSNDGEIPKHPELANFVARVMEREDTINRKIFQKEKEERIMTPPSREEAGGSGFEEKENGGPGQEDQQRTLSNAPVIEDGPPLGQAGIDRSPSSGMDPPPDRVEGERVSANDEPPPAMSVGSEATGKPMEKKDAEPAPEHYDVSSRSVSVDADPGPKIPQKVMPVRRSAFSSGPGTDGGSEPDRTEPTLRPVQPPPGLSSPVPSPPQRPHAIAFQTGGHSPPPVRDPTPPSAAPTMKDPEVHGQPLPLRGADEKEEPGERPVQPVAVPRPAGKVIVRRVIRKKE